MPLFENILIGIDPSWTDTAPAELAAKCEPFLWGVRLAAATGGRLLFFSALNTGEEILWPLTAEIRSRACDTAREAVQRLLEHLVQEARQAGVQADCELAEGDAWREITKRVVHDHISLVIAGTRNLTAIPRMLIGGTSRRLVHVCPCPVLVARTDIGESLNCLLATDLKPSSNAALRLGLDVAAALKNVYVHVMHVVHHELDDVCHIGLPDAVQEDYRRTVRVHAEAQLRAQVEAIDASRALPDRIEIHVLDGLDAPDVVIQQFIQAQAIGLMAIGTVGRSGMQGLMVGNTAERLLPQIHCSVLAVKPADYVCPIS